MTPQRIQRKRARGWRMPEGVIYVGRPTLFGNPFVPGIDGTRRECLERFEAYVTCEEPNHPDRDRFVSHQLIMRNLIQHKLRGHDLACWCKPNDLCHADVLLRIANA
jgi:hypothetical protein